MTTADLVGKLKSELEQIGRLARQSRLASFGAAWAGMAEQHWPDRAHIEVPTARSLRQQLQETLDDLDRQLDEVDFPPEVPAVEEVSIASQFEVLAPRDILRGYLVPVREVPVPLSVSHRVLALIAVADEVDKLDRHLEQGIHYHYVLKDGTHTTTMICWDNRWRKAAAPQISSAVRPIFHELHGRGAKTKKARPNLWSDGKRQSIWAACSPDLQKWNIGEFRCASNGASSVWPLACVVTPKP
ncbi:hypothetical protein PRN20_13935 [Devosia sp. ZB163]|uniref:hypothetical protein n=1 Tax=Devosia sp. ZB163 TaxID=3025938 RepID=UPI00235E2717|nr:hypothetical protein [Devosia sp. ZB163]MDC9824831.1 hypothetical protein [Devosia sp. ZB163]